MTTSKSNIQNKIHVQSMSIKDICNRVWQINNNIKVFDYKIVMSR